MKKISQREALRLKKRVAELDALQRRQSHHWATDWGPRWVRIESLNLTDISFAKIKTARALGHAVILVPSGSGTDVLLYAERLP